MTDDLVLKRANERLFSATLDGAEVCRVSVATADGVWELYSTVTSPAHQGRGIAARLVRFVLEEAECAGVRVIPSCWYVDGLMAKLSPRFDHLRVAHPKQSPDPAVCRLTPAVVPEDAALGGEVSPGDPGLGPSAAST